MSDEPYPSRTIETRHGRTLRCYWDQSPAYHGWCLDITDDQGVTVTLLGFTSLTHVDDLRGWALRSGVPKRIPEPPQKVPVVEQVNDANLYLLGLRLGQAVLDAVRSVTVDALVQLLKEGHQVPVAQKSHSPSPFAGGDAPLGSRQTPDPHSDSIGGPHD